MAIEVQCQCGKTLRVSDDLGGRRGRCPACSGELVIPLPLARTPCFCGHVIEFPPEISGTTSSCPKCERPIFLTDPRLAVGLDIETDHADVWPRCAGCGSRVTDPGLAQCPQCGANRRTGQINFRASAGRARRAARLAQPDAAPGVPVARVVSAPAAPMAAPVAPKAARSERPPRAALPPHDSSHVNWRDSEAAQLAEELAEELEGEGGGDLDFSPASLALLDWHFAECRREGALLSEFVHKIAYYLGEVVTRNLGGQWRKTTDGRKVIAHLPGEQSFDPVGQVKKRIPAGGGTFVQLFVSLQKQLGL